MRPSRRRILWPSKGPLHPTVRQVCTRFAVRLLILTLFAALPFAHGWGFARMFITLTGINTLSLVFLATFRRERPDTSAMTHWDEAIAMAALCVTGILIVHHSA